MIAGLVAELGFDEMIAVSGDDARLDGELAGVDVEPGARIYGEREVFARRIGGGLESHAGSLGDCEDRWDEVGVVRVVRVDVEVLADAKVEHYGRWLTSRDGDLLGE